MPTSLVSGRVNSEDKQRADIYIRRAGLTTSDVIKTVWSNIANTGEIPKPVQTPCNIESATDRLIQLRAKIPRSEFLENLTPEGLKEELKGKHG